MKTFEQITCADSESNQAILVNAGIKFAAGMDIIIAWVPSTKVKAIQSLIPNLELTGAVQTKYTKQEVAQSLYVRIGAVLPSGYPQPEDRYMEKVYRPGYCLKTGADLDQVSYFMMKNEIKWKKPNAILQLIWVDDVIFTSPETWENLFKKWGISVDPVLHIKSSKPLKSVVQLKWQELVNLALPDDHPYEMSTTGIPRYKPWAKGCLPGPEGVVNTHYFASRQWFGTGQSSFREILFSQKLYASIKDEISGLYAEPTIL